MYQPGDSVELYADIFPAAVVPLPPGVPRNTKMRVLCTRDYVSFAWQIGGTVQRLDVEADPEETKTVTFSGGSAAGYEFGRNNQCASCGAKKAASFVFFPGVIYIQTLDENLAKERAKQAPARREMTGLVPTRYSRSRR